jgi:hypothetical protein
MADRLEELLELEHAGWRSLCDGTGADFYGMLMTEHGCMILANGAVLSRDDVVSALAEAPPWSSYEIADPELVEIGDDAVGVVYTGTGRRDGDEFTGVMSSVYVRDASGWRMVLYQQTPRS